MESPGGADGDQVVLDTPTKTETSAAKKEAYRKRQSVMDTTMGRFQGGETSETSARGHSDFLFSIQGCYERCA